MFKMGHIYTIKRHEAKSHNSPLGLGQEKIYSFLQIRKEYNYMVEYDTEGYESDYFSLYFLED